MTASEQDWRDGLSMVQVLAAEQAAGRTAVAQAEAELARKMAAKAAAAECRRARRAPIIEKALERLVSSREERRERTMAKALANFEARELKLEERIKAGTEFSTPSFKSALWAIGLDPRGNPRGKVIWYSSKT